MNILCTICARSGSKGVKNKNLRPLQGLPVIAHTIRQARATGLFTKIAVSSDSPEILQASKEYGADILIQRPDELASDTAPKVPAIRHCFLEAEKQSGLKFDINVDLDCTSPLRLPEDIIGSVKLLMEKNCHNVITGCRSHRSPYFNLIEENATGVVSVSKKLEKPIARRQDAPKCFDMNASIYVWKRDALFSSDTVFLEDTMLFEMPAERSHDIDTELDFEIVEFLASKRKALS